MTRKRPYGTGYLRQKGAAWIIRWRATELAPDGIPRRVLKYENLGSIPKKEAARVLAERIAAGNGKPRARLTFAELSAQWTASVLPMHKFSTRKNRRHVLTKHLLPRFGTHLLEGMTPQVLQAFIADLERRGYAPKTIDHIHDVLSALLRTAVKWHYLEANPARDLDLPELRTVRPKWALTTEQAASLVKELDGLPRAMVGLALLTGLSRAELFALRWRSFDESKRELAITETVYEGRFGTTKTRARNRVIPLAPAATELLGAWRATAKRTQPEDLIFATRTGKPISPNNVLRRWVFPACDELGLPRTTWLTFRRTYASWAHAKGVPDKVLAALLGHANVNTTLNVYTQVLTPSLREAANTVGAELFTIVHNQETGEELNP